MRGHEGPSEDESGERCDSPCEARAAPWGVSPEGGGSASRVPARTCSQGETLGRIALTCRPGFVLRREEVGGEGEWGKNCVEES